LDRSDVQVFSEKKLIFCGNFESLFDKVLSFLKLRIAWKSYHEKRLNLPTGEGYPMVDVVGQKNFDIFVVV
jgi:hypothetical protein